MKTKIVELRPYMLTENVELYKMLQEIPDLCVSLVKFIVEKVDWHTQLFQIKVFQ